jgi:hypothetical protein
MSSLVISGDTSGAITLAAPAVAGTNTITLPASTGTVALTSQIKGPAFAAYSNVSQSISTQTDTKVQFNLKTFDTNSNYDTTNYRFTPTVAGYYQISACVTPSNSNYTNALIYKNGSLAYTGSTSGSNYAGAAGNISVLIYFNGSSDYVECYIGLDRAGTLYNINGWSWFQGVMVRTA